MKHLSLLFLSCLIASFASSERLSADAVAPPAALPADSTSPQQPANTPQPSPARPEVDDDYRRKAKLWGEQQLYRGKSEDEVYKDIKAENMHYRYVAFLEMFPATTHRAEIEDALKNFYVFQTKDGVTMPLDELKAKYHYDGVDSVYRWQGGLGFMLVGNDSQGAWRGAICYGNLQFLSGGFIHHHTSLEFLPGTEIIYPSEKP